MGEHEQTFHLPRTDKFHSIDYSHFKREITPDSHFDNGKIENTKDLANISYKRVCFLQRRTGLFGHILCFSQNWKDGMTGFKNSHQFDTKLMRNLEKHWGVGKFRTMQREICTCVLQKQDCVVVLPTGHGKSLTYQLPAVCEGGTTVVISPLSSLIQDQIYELSEHLRIAAISLDSLATGNSNQMLSLQAAKSGQYALVYINVETLEPNNSLWDVIQALYSKRLLRRFAVDESHCISQLGHDFRTSYEKLGSLRNAFPTVPILAVTATASNQVVDSIVNGLRMRDCYLFQHSLNRPNLYWCVREKKKIDLIADLRGLFDTLQSKHNVINPCGIIYCLNNTEADKTAALLRSSGLECVCVHFGMAVEELQKNLLLWKSDQTKLMVATCEFGVGVHKYDVRFVIHITMPKSLEDYYQQTGRAGRDGSPAWCVLYFTLTDRCKVQHAISQRRDNDNKFSQLYIARRGTISLQKKKKKQYNTNLLEQDQNNNVLKITRFYEMVCYGQNDVECRRICLLQAFGNAFSRDDCKNHCLGCDVCDSFAEDDENVVIDKNYNEEALAMVEIVQYLHRQKYQKKFCDLMLKIYRGSKAKDVVDTQAETNLPFAYGKGAKQTENEARRLLVQLLSKQVILEEIQVNHGNLTSILQPGPNAAFLQRGQINICLKMKQHKSEKDASTAGEERSNSKKNANSKTKKNNQDLMKPASEHKGKTKKKKKANASEEVEKQTKKSDLSENVGKKSAKKKKNE
ncbi:hypothetical protein RFI_05174 [Reticulomyxa filosa]|uniref:ATP-dependent DNA helicase n=1 Tax=Reticulomyxa filosa TaxID=46433 RepID=X6P305_RETFI|nr:hypothetical protein RFI_05174 [Reticulomyxa filosa]|eukprot:ETO31942.1 hypothetical protein RFI_05174 [Reticulomyxa filosa]